MSLDPDNELTLGPFHLIDVAEDVTGRLNALKRAGIQNIIRYDDRYVSGDWKQVHPAEAKAIAQHGMGLGIVYEAAGATPSTFSQSSGYLDASYSLAMASKRGQPDGSAVYFAVDFDPTDYQINNLIRPYFHGVYQAFGENQTLPHMRVGAYCSGACADALRVDHPDILIWITCSMGFRGSREWANSGKYTLLQKCDITVAGVDCDGNIASTEDWGWFIPWAHVDPPLPPVPPPPPVVTHDQKWLQSVLQSHGFYHGDIDGDIGPNSVAGMIAYMEAKEGGTS